MSQLNTNIDNNKTDEHGFLLDQTEWNERVAIDLALKAGVTADEMTTESLELLYSLREYHQKFKSFPAHGYICRSAEKTRDCLTVEFLDPITAWKIAGLPKPTDEVFAHLLH